MRSVLGRGLAALIPVRAPEKNGYVLEIAVDEIFPNPSQPRKFFNEEKLAELISSIKQHGVIQPIVVTQMGDCPQMGTVPVRDSYQRYQIVVGERRWRAAKGAGLETIPAVIKELSTGERVAVALVENLQRDDLNALEEAEAFDFLLKRFGMTQEELSKQIGRSRPYITNILRLLHLSPNVKSLLVEGKLSAGHARALLSVEDKSLALQLALRVIEEDLSVRQVENLLKPKAPVFQESRIPAMVDLEKKLRDTLGTRVNIRLKNGKGKLEISYSNVKELREFISLLLSAKGRGQST